MSLIYLYVFIAFIFALASVEGYRRRASDGGDLLRDVAALAAYALVTVAFFWQLVFAEGVSVPRGGGDIASFIYPVYSFAAATFQQGILPLWNPYLYGGSPFAADMQTGLFYPINLLAFLTATPFTYVTLEELAVVHFFLGACFTYLYVRSLAVNRVSSFVGGIIFAFGGFVTAHLGHLNMIAAAVWLPLVLLFFHRAVVGGSLVSAVIAGAVFGVSVLAGHIQITLYVALTLTLYWLWHLLYAQWRHQSPPNAPARAPLWPRLASLPVTALIALGASAVQLLPSYELTRLSVRAAITYAQASEYAASPTGLITLLIPHFYGDNPQTYWGLKWNIVEVYGYVGILPLLLALVAVALRRPRAGIVLFFSLLAVLALLLSLGEYTVLHGWLYKFVPGFDKVRSAGRFLLLFNFAIAVLAALGLEQMIRAMAEPERQWYRRVTYLGAAVLAAAVFVAAPFFYSALLTSQDKEPAVFQRIEQVIAGLNLSLLFLAASVGLLLFNLARPRRRLVLTLAALLITIDLFSANARFNPTTEDVLDGFSHPQIVQFLKDRTRNEPARIDSVTNVWDVWQPDATLLSQIGDVMGIFNPMLLADYNTYWEGLGSRSSPAYDILNARYVLARQDVVLDWKKFRPLLKDESKKLAVFENTAALPRAVLVPTIDVLSRDRMIERLRGSDFDPRKTALLEEPVAELPPASADGFVGRVLESRYPSPNELLVRTESNRAALLLISEVSYPGWTAFVDGSEARVLRANYTFKAVVVPAGAHDVKLVFKPRIWEIGAAISAVTWLLILGILVALLRPRWTLRPW